MTATRVFIKSGMRTVRLPAEFKVPDSIIEVTTCARGRKQVISPLLEAWNSFFESRLVVSTSFLRERSSQYHAEREDI